LIILDDSTSTLDRPTSRIYRGLVERIVAQSGAKVPDALVRIEEASRQGLYLVLVLDYALGSYFQGLASNKHSGPLLTGFVFQGLERMSSEAIGQLLSRQSDASIEAGVMNVGRSLEIESFSRDLEVIRSQIQQGTFYQLNHTFSLRGQWYGEPLGLFARLRRAQPTRFAAYIEDCDRTILSFSPELFLQHRGGVISAQPMKGTLSAAGNPLTGLRNDPKNRAENLMIVDLLRNDLGAVSQVGSVRVPSLFDVERIGAVYQMTSSIEAQLSPNATLEQVLRATFPCGSVTGAPKRKAMEWIEALEPESRGVYCGSLGWMDPPNESSTRGQRSGLGDFVLSVAIRTLTLRGNDFQMGVGAGITIDSQAQAEWQECLIKAEFVQSLQAAHGLFETILIENGKAPWVRLHVQRMARSARALGIEFSELLSRKKVQDTAKSFPQGTWRMRLSLDSSGALDAVVSPYERADSTALIFWAHDLLDPPGLQMNSSDPLLRHKSTRRLRYDDAWRVAEANGGFDAIFLNEKGRVTEGGRSSIWARFGQQWLTPPIEEGLLPGVARHLILANPANNAVEAALAPTDLERAEELRISNALNGWRPARLMGNPRLH